MMCDFKMFFTFNCVDIMHLIVNTSQILPVVLEKFVVGVCRVGLYNK